MPADGRCLFRAIAHVTCLRNGEEAPDENRQRDLADDLRAEVIFVSFSIHAIMQSRYQEYTVAS